MPAGNYNFPLVQERRDTTIRSNRGVKSDGAFLPLRTVWCSLTPISQAQTLYARQVKSLRTHTIRCRHFDDIGEDDRFSFIRPDGKKRIFHIEELVNEGEADVEWRITSQEVNPS